MVSSSVKVLYSSSPVIVTIYNTYTALSSIAPPQSLPPSLNRVGWLLVNQVKVLITSWACLSLPGAQHNTAPLPT